MQIHNNSNVLNALVIVKYALALKLMKKFSEVTIGTDSYEYTGEEGLKSFIIITARK